MGQRANYAIVGEAGLYYSNAAAVSLLRDFAAGPGEAMAFVRAQRPVEHWLDDVWCEGAAVIDPVHQVLLLFTWHHNGTADRARRLAGVRAAWPGWEVRWAYAGIEDVVAYLGLDRLSVRTEIDQVTALHLPPPEYAEDATCVLTIRHEDGTLRGYSVYHEFCEPVRAGSGLLDMAAPLTPVRGRGVLSGSDVGPTCGVHLDVARREVGFWTTETFKGSLDDIAACWPGWRFEFWEDRHAEHTKRCGDDFEMFPF